MDFIETIRYRGVVSSANRERPQQSGKATLADGVKPISFLPSLGWTYSRVSAAGGLDDHRRMES